MKLICYPLLSTRSKWALTRQETAEGRPYDYEPRAKLVNRLAQQLNKGPKEIKAQLQKERRFLIAAERALERCKGDSSGKPKAEGES